MNTNGSKWIRPEKRKRLYERDRFECMYCGMGIEDGAALTLDHVTARELGGTNEATNLVTACLTCNSAKRSLSVRQFLVHLRDNGVDTTGMARRIRKATSRKF